MGRTGSTLILLVVALGLGGYLYFVESDRPVPDENAKAKVFAYDSTKINQLQIKSSTGEVTSLRKGANDIWTIVQPTNAPADRNAVSDVVTNLANLEEQRVVDENAADLKTYGLAEPVVDVTADLHPCPAGVRRVVLEQHTVRVGEQIVEERRHLFPLVRARVTHRTRRPRVTVNVDRPEVAGAVIRRARCFRRVDRRRSCVKPQRRRVDPKLIDREAVPGHTRVGSARRP